MCEHLGMAPMELGRQVEVVVEWTTLPNFLDIHLTDWLFPLIVLVVLLCEPIAMNFYRWAFSCLPEQLATFYSYQTPAP